MLGCGTAARGKWQRDRVFLLRVRRRERGHILGESRVRSLAVPEVSKSPGSHATADNDLSL